MRLKTDRLLLRPLDPADARWMAHLLEGDPAAVRMTEGLTDPCGEAAAGEWIDRRRGPGERTFAIERESAFIGCIGLSIGGREAGLGYWLGRPYWNNGLATEAGRAIVELARTLGVTTIVADAFLSNPASARVLGRLNFKKCDLHRKSHPKRGGLRTLQRFQLKLACKFCTISSSGRYRSISEARPPMSENRVVSGLS